MTAKERLQRLLSLSNRLTAVAQKLLRPSIAASFIKRTTGDEMVALGDDLVRCEADIRRMVASPSNITNEGLARTELTISKLETMLQEEPKRSTN